MAPHIPFTHYGKKDQAANVAKSVPQPNRDAVPDLPTTSRTKEDQTPNPMSDAGRGSGKLTGIGREGNGRAVEEIGQSGAQVHSFDADASPAEKAAQFTAQADQLSPVNGLGSGDSSSTMGPKGGQIGTEIPVDSGNAQHIELTGGLDEAKAEDEIPAAVDTQDKEVVDNRVADVREDYKKDGVKEVPPGTLSNTTAPGKSRPIPDWFKQGWRAAGGIDEDEQARTDNDILEDWLNDIYFGQSYHNAAVIFFAVIATYIFTSLGGGLGLVIIVLGFCSTYYSTSIRRTRRNARDDAQREVAKKALESDHESMEWMNTFLTKFWLIYEPVLSATVVAAVDQILAVSTPAFLDSIRMTTFTLGTKAPRIEYAKTYPKSAEDTVLMDWKASFTPNDTEDLTSRQLTTKVNPKVVLAIRVGKGLVGASLPVLVEDITFKGLLRVKLHLMTSFPHVKTVDISFLEKPEIDYVLRPIGGSHGMDINSIPGLSGFIREQMHSTLGPMMYEPNVFTLNLEQMLSGAKDTSAVGVLQLTVYNAKGIKGIKVGGGTPDPYIRFSIHGKELARTSVRQSTINPHWNEKKFLVLSSLNEMLDLEIMDYNSRRADTSLGLASFDLSKLEANPEHEGVVVQVKREGKERGEVRMDALYYPVLQAKKLEDGTLETLPETSCGITKVFIHAARDLDASKSMVGQLNPYVVLSLNGVEVNRSHLVKRNNNPVFEDQFELLITDRTSCVLGFKVVDDRGLVKDPELGHSNLKLTDLLAAREAKQDWFPLAGAKTGRIRLSAEWKPVLMSGSVNGSGGYIPPIGIIRLHMKGAHDLKNVEALTGGKSDPYVRVLLNNSIMNRTLVIDNNLAPQWDEIIYVPVHSTRETFVLEVMDYQHLTRDRSLGLTEFDVQEFVRINGEDSFASLGRIDRHDPLRESSHKSVKGALNYTAHFYPCYQLDNMGLDNDLESDIERTGATDGSATDMKSEGPPNESTASSHQSQNTHHAPQKSVSEAAAGLPSGHVRSDSPANVVGNGGASAGATTANAVLPKYIEGKKHKPGALHLGREQLINHQSGILVINILDGQISRKGASLEVLFDDGYWPAYITEPARSLNARWDEVADAFVKELEFSAMTIRLNTSQRDDSEEIFAQLKLDVKDFISQSLDQPFEYTLRGEGVNKVRLSCKYIPVDITLEARESINNQGYLRVDVAEGIDIPAADRSGKSDPYAIFTLNGEKVHRTKHIRKTLHPKWDETFETMVRSRVGANFIVEVFDWNQLENHKKLGSGTIDLENGVEPFQARKMRVKLDGKSGEIALNLVFRPEFIQRQRKNTSTFSTGMRAVTGLGRAPVHVVGGVGKFAGKNVLRGAGGVLTGAGLVAGGAFAGAGMVAGGAGRFVRRNTLGQEEIVELPEGSAIPADAVPADEATAAKVVPIEPSVNGAGGAQPTLLPEDEGVSSKDFAGIGTTADGAPVTGNLDATASRGSGIGFDGHLNVMIIAGKNLKAVDAKSNTSDANVELYVNDRKVFRTKTIRKALSPSWNETHRVTTYQGRVTSLTFTIQESHTIGKDKHMGSSAINAFEEVGPIHPEKTIWLPLTEEGQLQVRLSFVPREAGLAANGEEHTPKKKSSILSLK